MKILVDADLCQGHAVCQDEAPAAFHVPKHGQAEVLPAAGDPEVRADVQRAVRYCPTQALSIVEDS
ncbi:ferredoxin [Nocardia sp. 004]|uniref:ferredoxin n=1 Tax=Nocardia sp. 004 TaxID=3385978 RepID=UPI0039A1330B